MKRILKVAAAIVLVLFLLAFFGVRAGRTYVAEHHVEPHVASLVEDTERFWPRVQADLEAVRADPFFTSPREGGDAGALLAVTVPWRGVPDDVEVPAPTAALPRELVEHLRGGAWLEDPELVSADELEALDFGWLQELERYGYWSLEGHPAIAGAGPVNGVTMPMPDISALSAWTKLRLLDGQRRGELENARRQVRHLAWLTISTEYLLGAVGGAALLGLEEKARAAFAPDAPEAAPARKAFHRAVWVLNGLELAAVPAALRQRARSLAEGTPALCVGLSEVGMREPLLRPLLHDHLPELFAERDATFASPPPPCRLTLARRTRSFAVAEAVDRPEDVVAFRTLVPTNAAEEVLDALLLGPVRQGFGLYLATVAQADPYREYRDAP